MSDFDQLIDDLTEADRQNPSLPQMIEPDDESIVDDTIELSLKKKRVELDAASGKTQDRDKSGKWTKEGGSSRPLASHASSSSAAEFYSPNTGEMNFNEAFNALNSDGQQHARAITDDIDEQLGIQSTSQDGVGDWSDGAENSVVHTIENIKWDTLRYSAALKGRALNQKAVLAFKADENGGDAIHSVTLPTNDLQDVREQLAEAGIQHRTMLPDGENTHILVFDIGNKLGDNLLTVANHYGDTKDKWEGIQVETIRGKGEFVGDSDTREGATENFNAIIHQYERDNPDRRYQPTQGQSIHSNGSKVTEASVYASAAKVKPKLDEILNKVASDHKALAITSPLKRLARAREKVEADYDGDWSRIKDVVRGRIVTDSDDEIDAVAADLEKRLGIKPKVTISKDSGYRDFKFNPVIDGQTTEIGVMTNRISNIATSEAHVFYEKSQALERKAKKEKRALTGSELVELSFLNNQMKSLFGQGAAHAI